jgi:hypothetical protein
VNNQQRTVKSAWPRISQATRRDWNNVKLAAREFVDDMRDPWNLVMLIIASTVVAVFMLLPWLTTD